MEIEVSGIKRIGHVLKAAMPLVVFSKILLFYHAILGLMALPKSYFARRRVGKTIDRIKGRKGKIRFGFYVVLESMFQMRRVFELMLNDDRFDPFIVVVPRIGYQVGDMAETVDKTYQSLVRDFDASRVYKGFENDMFKNYIDRCDACTMMNLYSGLADGRFEAEHFARHGVPIFGAPYFYLNASLNISTYYGMRSLRYIRKFFCSNGREKNLFARYQGLRKDSDVPVVTGCPKSDAIRFHEFPRSVSRKTILITPHHSTIPTIDNGFCIGNFLRLKDFFLQLPKRYPDIHWIFRPHPHLRLRLTKDGDWTMEQWNQYVGKFASTPNAEYESGGTYYDSFESSDAIINDCGSFLPEYFYTGKPHCYMLASEQAKREQFDEWGQELLAHTYQAFTEQDIIRFIEDVVIGGKDTMREMRQKFAREKVMINYPHASEAVLEDIAETLGRGKGMQK